MKTFFLSVISCFILSACDNNDCPDELLYELPFTLLNPSDTISMGDTLWYESRFSNVLFDEKSNIKNVFDDYDFSFISCFLTRIDSTVEQGGGFNLELINIEGSLKKFTFSDGYDFYDLVYTYKLDQYNLKFGLVINDPGLFTVQFGYLNSEKKVQTNCTSHPVAWSFLLSEKNTNFNMLQSSPILFWQTYKSTDWDRLASYCLYVKP